MDDAKDDIRVQSGELWASFFKAVLQWKELMVPFKNSLPEEDRNRCAVLNPSTNEIVEIDLEGGHFETILNGLFIHLDDTNYQVQVSLV